VSSSGNRGISAAFSRIIAAGSGKTGNRSPIWACLGGTRTSRTSREILRVSGRVLRSTQKMGDPDDNPRGGTRGNPGGPVVPAGTMVQPGHALFFVSPLCDQFRSGKCEKPGVMGFSLPCLVLNNN
jgi:hypothetical protein